MKPISLDLREICNTRLNNGCKCPNHDVTDVRLTVTLFCCCFTNPPENLFLLISFVLSIPASNAFPERVFSLMNAKWRADRNKMTVGLVKAELQVFTNYNVDCRSFHSFALADKKMLAAAASNEKYTGK